MAGIPNLQPQYNVCPTDPVDIVLPNDGARELAENWTECAGAWCPTGGTSR